MASATAALAQPSLGAGHGHAGVRGRLADDDAGPVEQRERAGVTGMGVKYLGRAERRERHDVRQR